MIRNRILPRLIKFFERRLDYLDPYIRQLSKGPRYSPGEILFFNHKFKYADNASFLFTYREIFKKRIYRFESDVETPYIIDGGANIGLSIIYFKSLFPGAEIVAFEPDNKIFNILKNNIASFGFSDIALVKKALWNSETNISFIPEGADAGRISEVNEKATRSEAIETIRLNHYLTRDVDLLKMDIEGAEYVVLKDCEDLLRCVKRIFVEYHSFVGQEQMLPELLAILKRSGFRVTVGTPGLVSKHPFLKFDNYLGMDMQLNIYGKRD